MNSDYPYITFLNIAKECRKQLIKDVIKNESVDLFDALYSDSTSEIFETKMQLYELKWIELHWSMLEDLINNRDMSDKEKNELICFLAKYYGKFIKKWNYSRFENKIQILKNIVSINNEWEQNIKQMEVAFKKSKKQLNAKIEKLKNKEC